MELESQKVMSKKLVSEACDAARATLCVVQKRGWQFRRDGDEVNTTRPYYVGSDTFQLVAKVTVGFWELGLALLGSADGDAKFCFCRGKRIDEETGFEGTGTGMGDMPDNI